MKYLAELWHGLPVVYINIDEEAEGFGTIEEMNSSPDHSVKCTGTLSVDVPEGYTGDYSDNAANETLGIILSIAAIAAMCALQVIILVRFRKNAEKYCQMTFA